MVLPRFACAILLLCAQMGTAWAEEGSGQGAGEAGRSPGERAVVAEERVAQGADVPQLSEPPAMGDLLGKPIVRIEVLAQGDRWNLALPIVSVELGEPLSAEAARRAMRELLATGNYARVAAETAVAEDGVALKLFVLPHRLIATIQLTGGVLDLDRTLETAAIAEGKEVTSPMLGEIAQRIQKFYVDHGYTAAKVHVDTIDTDDPARVVLAIEVVPGNPRTIAQRVFVIEPLADREVGKLKTRYRVGSGARVDERALVDADREMVDVLRQNGFHRAEVTHLVVHEGAYSYLFVYMTPGPRIVPVFEGNRVFDDDTLEEALDLEQAADTRPAELVDRLRTFYVQRGFFDVEVKATERGGPKDPVHYLAFTIAEHQQVRVRKRIFPCLSGDLSADEVGKEIESFLEEDLPGAEFFSLANQRMISPLFGPTEGAGHRPPFVDLNPAMTYDPETYDRAIKHLRDLYHSKGYLNAVIGPVSVIRATCKRRTASGVCIEEPAKDRAIAQCRTDALNLPLPEPPVADSLTCRPDPEHNIDCSSDMVLRIPIHLGPQTILYDMAAEGNKGLSEQELFEIADLTLGQPLSNLALDTARIRVLDAYRNKGYAYAEVRTVIEPSPDRTRARARFVVTEREQVRVRGFVIKGAVRTNEDLILRRVALEKGQPYTQEGVRLSEERIATLGTFSSVSIGLEDPDIPQKDKRVVITVAEQLPQYLEPRIGFSTGEGFRFAVEYGHRNIGGLAISLALRIQINYLFEFMILDPGVRANYEPLTVGERLERRNTVSVTFPEIGLGPLVSLSVEGVDVRDNQRDFGLTKDAVIPVLTYRPRRSLTSQFAISTELNDVSIFNQDALDNAISLLRVPEGRTIALAQRLNLSWDGRNSPFAATKGVLIAAGAEHVNAFDIGATVVGADGDQGTVKSHFMRLSGRVAGYIPISKKGAAMALSMSAGYNLQLESDSLTYPDRLFFLGGVDSLRAFLADSVVPEDIAQQIIKGELNAEGKRVTIDDIAIRGGDVALNPRAELRFPLSGLLQGGLFLDTGNLWVDPTLIDFFALRYAAGAGLRITTPIGPLALDYGINLIRRPWEDFGAFHFSIGLF